jgi:hypothetical protein
MLIFKLGAKIIIQLSGERFLLITKKPHPLFFGHNRKILNRGQDLELHTLQWIAPSFIILVPGNNLAEN